MRTVLVDGSELFRDCLAAFLKTRGHKIVSSAGNLSEALEHVNLVQVDVFLLDASQVDESSADLLARHIRGPLPRVILLIPPGAERSAAVSRSLPSHTVHVERSSGLKTLERAIQGIAVLPRRPQAGPQLRGQALTVREHEVIGGLVRGQSTVGIADDLGVSIHTVHAHVQGILRKLESRTRLEAVSNYLGAGSPARGRDHLSGLGSRV